MAKSYNTHLSHRALSNCNLLRLEGKDYRVPFSSPQTQALFKIHTTRIFALFQPPSSHLAAVAVLCPALPDTVATQCSVHYLFQSLNSLSMYLSPLSFPPSQKKAGFYVALALPKVS